MAKIPINKHLSKELPAHIHDLHIDKLQMSNRLRHCLKNENITTVSQLLSRDFSSWSRVKGLGSLCLKELKSILKSLDGPLLPHIFKDVKSVPTPKRPDTNGEGKEALISRREGKQPEHKSFTLEECMGERRQDRIPIHPDLGPFSWPGRQGVKITIIAVKDETCTDNVQLDIHGDFGPVVISDRGGVQIGPIQIVHQKKVFF